MTVAILEIYFQGQGSVSNFMVFESSGELFNRLKSAAEHDDRVPNFNYHNNSVRTTIRIDKLVNWIVSSGYKLHTVLPSVYDESMQRSPEKYIFEKANHYQPLVN